jgi:glycosyltransferase involved in cell wall biosynthesis
VHVPIDKYVEAFGQTYVEALAMGIPSVFTLSGIANDFIEDKRNAVVVPHCDSDAIYEAIVNILNNSNLRQNVIENGRTDVFNRFNLRTLGAELDLIYSKL